MSEHPEWLAVGERVLVVRRHGHSVSWRHEATIARHTKTSVVLDNGDRFALKWGDYQETPKYLDYTTTLEPAP